MAPRPGIERFFEDALDVGYRGDTSLHRRPPTFVDRVDIDHPDGGANQRALSVSREAGLEIASASGLSAERAERIVLKSIKRVLHQHVRELRSRQVLETSRSCELRVAPMRADPDPVLLDNPEPLVSTVAAGNRRVGGREAMAERTNRPRSVGSVKNLERLTSASRELGWSEEDLDLDRLTRMVTELAEYLNQEARSGEEASRGPAAPEPQSSHGSVVPFPAPPRGDD